MKKSFFLSILAVGAVLAGCSKVVDSSVMNNAISFDNYVGRDAMTKAAIVTGADIESVNVNAYLYKKDAKGTWDANFMENQVVNSDGTYSPVKFWPAEDQVIDFVGWVPVDNAEVSDATLTFEVPAEVTEQTDLLVADPQIGRNGDVVNLNFKHLLSRIGFQVNAAGIPADTPATEEGGEATPAANIVKLTSITLNGSFASAGTVDMTATTPAVAVAEDNTPTKAYVLTGEHFDMDENRILTGEYPNNDDAYIMLIPTGNEPTDITVTYTITTTETNTVITNTATFPITTPYVVGKAYKYIFEIELDQITFKVEETEWDETNANPGTTLNPDEETPAA